MNFKDLDDIPYDTFNRILWGDAMGWNTPFPKLPKSRREATNLNCAEMPRYAQAAHWRTNSTPASPLGLSNH